MRATAFLCCLVLLLVAGCAAPQPSTPGPTSPPPPVFDPNDPWMGKGEAVAWSPMILIDDVRAGGEPVITITPKGTILVSSHPGYTHVHPEPGQPTGPEAVLPTQAQSYMWRSTDGGKTWTHISLVPVPLPNSGPRGAGQGVSDPEFTIDANGRIWFTDLEALASASVSWSDDDGATWLQGNNAASGGVVDRQWLASFGDEVYFMANYMSEGQEKVRASKDGINWEERGVSPCSGDLVAHPVTGTLYAGCGDGVAVSKDGGRTWEASSAGVGVGGHGMTEPAIDAAGTIYMASDPDYKDVMLLTTEDEGTTWSNLSLKQYFPELSNGTLLWPWVSAGSAGRVSVTFFASAAKNAHRLADAEWHVYNFILIDDGSNETGAYATRVTSKPFHKGAICQSGTLCQASTATDDRSDRRLGDFFETTIDAQGRLHVVFANTFERPADTVSHVGYAQMAAGPRLVVSTLPKGLPTQG